MGSKNVVRKQTNTKKKRTYNRKCGICGDRHEQSIMVRTNQSSSGWLCQKCAYDLHPEYEIEFD